MLSNTYLLICVDFNLIILYIFYFCLIIIELFCCYISFQLTLFHLERRKLFWIFFSVALKLFNKYNVYDRIQSAILLIYFIIIFHLIVALLLFQDLIYFISQVSYINLINRILLWFVQKMRPVQVKRKHLLLKRILFWRNKFNISTHFI